MKKLFLMLMTFLMMSVCINAQEVTTSKIDSLENRISNLEEEVKFSQIEDILLEMSSKTNQININANNINILILLKQFDKNYCEDFSKRYLSEKDLFNKYKNLIEANKSTISLLKNGDYILQTYHKICINYEFALLQFKVSIDGYEIICNASK